MKRRLFAALLPLFLLTGCWDYTEPNMQSYVLGMSVDFIENQYLVCIETVKITGEPESLSASDGVMLEARGLTMFDAVRDAIMSAGKKLYWGHAELVILGEQVAREQLVAVTDVLSRAQDVYSNVSLAVASDGCTAKQVLSAKSPRGTIASEHISHVLQNEEASRRFVDTELWQLQRGFPYTLLPAVHLDHGQQYPVVEGCAVIQNKALVGYLSGEEVQAYSLVDSACAGGYLPAITLDSGAVVSLEILRAVPTRLKDQTRLDVIVSLSSVDGVCDIMDSALRHEICEKASALLSRQLGGLIAKPFGNPLPDSRFDVHVSLHSAGLLRRST